MGGKEREMARAARQLRKGFVETGDITLGIASGGGQKTDDGIGTAGLLENVPVKQRVVRLHRKAASTQGDDLAL
jgi:hypothetical protein